MSELAAFFAALDTQVAGELIEAEVSTDGRLPTSERWAERAGVTLDELAAVIGDRVSLGINALTVKMLDGTVTPLVAMRTLACAAALEFFEAGVLWEQQRNLPRLEPITLEACGETREAVWEVGDVCPVCGIIAELHDSEEC